MQDTSFTDIVIGNTDPYDSICAASASIAASTSRSPHDSRDHIYASDVIIGNTDPNDSVRIASDSVFTGVAGYSGDNAAYVELGDTDTDDSVRAAAIPNVASSSRGSAMSIGSGGIKKCEFEFAVIR